MRGPLAKLPANDLRVILAWARRRMAPRLVFAGGRYRIATPVERVMGNGRLTCKETRPNTKR